MLQRTTTVLAVDPKPFSGGLYIVKGETDGVGDKVALGNMLAAGTEESIVCKAVSQFGTPCSVGSETSTRDSMVKICNSD